MLGHRSTSFIGLAFTVVFASATVGTLVGFTFGVPKVASGDNEAISTSKFGLNTNFARVSDWLTTIIVGLSLVQFNKVLDGMGWLGEKFGAVFDTEGMAPEAASAFGMGLVISGFGVAFVLMYMWTSTRLLQIYVAMTEKALALAHAEQELGGTPWSPGPSQ